MIKETDTVPAPQEDTPETDTVPAPLSDAVVFVFLTAFVRNLLWLNWTACAVLLVYPFYPKERAILFGMAISVLIAPEAAMDYLALWFIAGQRTIKEHAE